MPGIVPPLDTPTNGAVAVGIATTVVRTANGDRRYLLLVNDSDTIIYIALGANAVLHTGITLEPNGGWYEMLDGQNLYLGAINAITTVAGKVLTYVEA
jgi:hypothetical protein